MKSNRFSMQIGFLALLISIAIIIFYLPGTQKNTDIPDELSAVLRSYKTTLKPFRLINQYNQPFTVEQLKGKQSLVFFGYTSCPDICPTTLTTLNHVVSILDKKERGRDLQVIFVSLDPRRDTTNNLAEYMNYFNKQFIALTGEKNELDRFVKQFGAGYFIEPGETDDSYLISHASSIFMVDRNNRVIAAFSPPHDPATIVNQYLSIIRLFNSD